MKVICYLSLGYPTIKKSIEVAGWYVQGGCDAVEICIPCPNPFLEKETIKGWMTDAYNRVPDYNAYLDSIKEIADTYPSTELFIMVYNEVIETIGAQYFSDFYHKTGISSLVSADLSDETIAVFRQNGVKCCDFASFRLLDEELERCRRPGGFIYTQANPRLGQKLRPGYETLQDVIRYLRKNGVTRPLYCGGGIKDPENAKQLKEAGADGFFIGTAIIEHISEPDKMVDLIRTYKRAVK